MQFALRSEKKVSILDLINLFNCSRLCEILIHSLPLIEFIFMMSASKLCWVLSQWLVLFIKSRLIAKAFVNTITLRILFVWLLVKFQDVLFPRKWGILMNFTSLPFPWCWIISFYAHCVTSGRKCINNNNFLNQHYNILPSGQLGPARQQLAYSWHHGTVFILISVWRSWCPGSQE